MEYAVKPGVELPSRDTLNSGRKAKFPFAEMEVGDVIFIPDRTTREMSTYAASRGRRLGRKFSTQSAWMRKDLETEQWELCRPNHPGGHQGVAIKRIA